jgi:hypothetical protein
VAAEPAQPHDVVPQLTSDSDVASAGFFQLSWKTDAQRVELQEATNPGFRNAKTFYIGPDRASVISGKPNGSWYYRVRALDPEQGGWSEPVTVLVDHHDLSRALMFLFVGVIVFVATVVMILRGGRAEK